MKCEWAWYEVFFILMIGARICCLRALIASRNENEKQQKYREIVCFFHSSIALLYARKSATLIWQPTANDGQIESESKMISMITCRHAISHPSRLGETFLLLQKRRKKSSSKQNMMKKKRVSRLTSSVIFGVLMIDSTCFYVVIWRIIIRRVRSSWLTTRGQHCWITSVFCPRERIQRLRNFLFRRRAADWSSYLSVGLTDGFDGKNDDHTLEY